MGAHDGPGPSSHRVEPGSVNVPLGEYPASATSSNVDAHAVASDLVSRLATALAAKDFAALSTLFLEDKSYWRDHLGLSWDLRTLKGSQKITAFVEASKTPITLFEVDDTAAHRAPVSGPIDGGIGDVNGVQSYVRFESDVGRGRGVVTLAEENGAWKFFTIFTVLEELKGYEEPVGRRRTKGVQHGGDPARKNWKKRREAERNLEGVDPKVLIIGAGQGGLTAAARLKMLNVTSLMIDTNERVGDNWRKRYHQLVLHDPVWYDHMPYFPFPTHWPIFTPKDKLADFFESYVSHLELNAWTSTTLKSTSWDESKKQWTVTLERRKPDGTTETRTLHPNHIIQATGHSGKKNFPTMKGMESFAGDRLCHSSDFSGAYPNSQGKKAVIVGSCNSGHDIAQDFYEKGYSVTMVQRSTTCVISSSSITNIGLKGLYDEDGPPVEDADMALWSMPSSLLKSQQIKVTKFQNEHDKALLDGLRAAGFGIDMGDTDSGLFLKYFQRGGGYYIDVGASQLIVDGKIAIKQGQEISQILPRGIEFADGSTLDADEIVFATGYQNMRSQARIIFGDELADRVGDVWGLNNEGEFRTMWQKSGHPGFWFMGGNLAVSRYYSRVLALQIKAAEEGLVEREVSGKAKL
ncbi:FAD/NAD(P)-binding domain-containing protein [Massarina eburnea CBS 473.64]|uniref:FAD/NAD(P)-binding domain-containing protein n=1 Tax=Massarina eburnea CBS 473.64 TaxID=1395130 RepID=A0A6A6SHY4_9PLEO|nr:FAD/NAD(P)-binding domain-containing protein [Massarina eburnea CBS 473.64]